MILTILLCAAGTMPADCTAATAIDVISRPATVVECAMPWHALPDLPALRAEGLTIKIGGCR